MDILGPIVRLQVQQSSLKVGAVGKREYDPSPIVSVSAVQLSDRGVTGIDRFGAPLADVHNLDHPDSKNRDGVNGISVLFTSHYTAMRERFGPHLTDGIAGESILVQTTRPVSEEAVGGGITIRTAAGEDVPLVHVSAAEPCVEFTRFAIHYPADARSDRRVTEALAFLRAGMRGFYAEYLGSPISIRLGDAILSSAR